MSNRTGGTYSLPISEMHLGKFLDFVWNFKAGKLTSRMRYVQEQ